jgi:hypothetical protein
MVSHSSRAARIANPLGDCLIMASLGESFFQSHQNVSKRKKEIGEPLFTSCPNSTPVWIDLRWNYMNIYKRIIHLKDLKKLLLDQHH